MERQVCFFVLFSICFLQCYARINNRKLIILSSQLSDDECKQLLMALYKKPAHGLVHAHQHTGICSNDLKKWLLDVDDDVHVLKELHQALVKLNRPALGREMLIEVYNQKRDL